MLRLCYSTLSFSFRCSRVLKATFSTYLVLLLVPAIVAGQRVQHKPLPNEEHERYDDSPSSISGTGLSPGMVSQHAGFTSYQVNVGSNGQNITGDAANEPSISVD